MNFFYSDKASTTGQEPLVEIEASVRNKKITCAVQLFQAFINAKPGEVPNYMEILNSNQL